jgi:hypothetical protein
MKQNGYDTLGWIKKEIMNSLIKFKINKIVVKIVADYFNINIFLLNIIEDKIYVASDNLFFDMFRPSIFLAFNNDTFEPLIYSDSNLLDYNSGPIKKLITVDKNFISLIDANLKNDKQPPFMISLSNLNKYIKEEKKEQIQNNIVIKEENKESPENSIDPTPEVIKSPEVKDLTSEEIENDYGEVILDESDANLFINDIKDIEEHYTPKAQTQLIFKISPKMKLDEIQEIAKKLNIVLAKEIRKGKMVSNKHKTKGELIDEINTLLKN